MKEDYQITPVPLGEVRMGAEGFGTSIAVKGKHIRCLEKEVVFVEGWVEPSSEEFIELSTDGRFLLIHGTFSIFVVDIGNASLSLFKDTVRSADGIWCEETPIFGREVCHVNGARRHYYLQFPFLSEAEFVAQRASYHQLRRRQIAEAKKLSHVNKPRR